MIDQALRFIVPCAYSVLPKAMASPAATAMLLAIGLQESKFLDRRQVLESGNRGPAAGFWQFERGGAVKGVLTHAATRGYAVEGLRELRYADVTLIANSLDRQKRVHGLLEHNDVLACVFARLLLWTLPARLPHRGQVAEGWDQYLEAWRPGRPHRVTWPSYFSEAWARVDQLETNGVHRHES